VMMLAAGKGSRVLLETADPTRSKRWTQSSR
jgi:hypothetical protein